MISHSCPDQSSSNDIQAEEAAADRVVVGGGGVGIVEGREVDEPVHPVGPEVSVRPRRQAGGAKGRSQGALPSI